MSAQSGIYYFDGRPVDPRLLTLLGNTIVHRGPDGGGEYLCSSIGMACRAFHTNKCSRHEVQPFISQDGRVMTWDGRLDNRDDLLEQLQANIEGSLTDGAIVMAAHQKWGEDCFVRLIGDWALALWDPKTQTLLLGRDFAGNRPLYYSQFPHSILWSSELETFLDLCDASSPLCDAYLLGFLVSYPDPHLTPYSRIYQIPPGQIMRVVGRKVTFTKHWQPDLNANIFYRRDEDYEDHFRSLFRAAVASRLRAEGAVWAELSGGLDSSAIVCFADDVIACGDVEAQRLESLSYLFEHSQSTDERYYIGLVETKRGEQGHYLHENEYSLFFPPMDQPFLTRPQIGAGRSVEAARLVERGGGRVLLSGQGGDSVMWSMHRPCLQLADLTASGNWLQLHKQLKAFSLSTKSTYWHLLWYDVISKYFRSQPQFERRRMAVDPWINWERVKELAGNGDRDSAMVCVDSAPKSRREALSYINDTIRLFSLHRFRTCGRLEVSFPYIDRRLVQFMLAIPFDQKLRPGITRSLHRRAMKNIMPGEIVCRTSKAGAQEAVCRALTREWDQLELLLDSNARVAQRRYVELPKLITSIEKARNGQQLDVFSLIRVLSLEVWLRALEKRRANAVVVRTAIA